MSVEAMYVDAILDYYRHPRNYGNIENPDASARDTNPLCGDVVEIHIKLNSDKISDVKFSGSGCAISQASASMLTEFASGKTLKEIRNMTKEDVLDLLGIEVSAVRMKCALLGLKVLKLAAYSYMREKMSEEEGDSL